MTSTKFNFYSDHIAQATRAFQRDCNAHGWIDQQPASADSYEVKDEDTGKRYVHLGNLRGTLAVYEILQSGRLRSLEPAEWLVALWRGCER